MRVDNSTPFLFGSRFTTWKRQHFEMTAIVRATFSLVADGIVTVPEGHPLIVQGAMTGDVFRDEDDDFTGECLYPSDYADFKKNAEVMLRGTCYVPGQKPVPECPVHVSVGPWSKTLRVVGPRVFTGSIVGASSTNPIPFARMPLALTHAYGGPGYDANPVGKGYGSNELPNIEYPGEEIRSPRDQARPACFGPINPFWKSRNVKRGQESSAKRDPFAYPEDFDISFFQAAPTDQQWPGYLAGDEEIVLHNLHPTIPVLRTRLPGLRVRVFVHHKKHGFREVPMVIDTLFIDAERETATLTYRGGTPVEEYDLSDVGSVLIASEKATDPPLAFDHYRAEHARNEADPYQIRQRVPEHLQALAHEVLHHQRISIPEDAPSSALDPVSQLIQSQIGHLAPAEQERVREAIRRALATKMPAGVDLLQQLKQGVTTARNAIPPAPPPAPGVVNLREYRIDATFRKLRTLVEQLKSDPTRQRMHLEGIQSIENLLQDPRFASVAQEKPSIEPGPGLDLSGQDFSGRDLRGRDFSGTNLTGAIFARADLREANLRGACLKQAVLKEANLSGADLTLANLTQANASNADLTNAKLGHTTLHQTVFTAANLECADFGESTGAMAVFTKANLSQAKAAQTSFERCFFHEAKLQHADFSRAKLDSCHFGACDLTDARFDDATVTKTSFAGAIVVRTKFIGTQGKGPTWMNATIADADFRYAVFDRPFFSGAKTTNSTFYGANMREAQFHRATLERVDLGRANLAGANLASAELTNTSFTESNLFGTNFAKAQGRGCSFQGANLKRSSLEQTS